MEWVRTQDKFPHQDDRRQFLAIHEKLDIGFLLNYTSPYLDPYWAFTPDHEWYICDLSQVTHWMPLPERPKDE